MFQGLSSSLPSLEITGLHNRLVVDKNIPTLHHQTFFLVIIPVVIEIFG